MNKLKEKNRGITLIALVITIIVLLILAGISINMLMGENSIIKQSGNTKKQTDIAHEKEIVQTAILSAISKETYGELNIQKLNDELNNNAEVESIEEDEEGFVVTFKSDRMYLIDAEKNVDEYFVADRTGMKVGDYIDYTPSVRIGELYVGQDNNNVSFLSDTYTGSLYNTTDLTADNIDWQILRIYSNGSMDLIGSVTNNKIRFSNLIGYTNGVYIMNDICKSLYSRMEDGIEARSINLKDLEYWLTENGMNTRQNYTSSGSIKYGGSMTYNAPCNKYPPLYKTQNNECDSGILTNSATYIADGILESMQTYYSLIINEANFGEGYKSIFYKKQYWIASRYTNCDSTYAGFGLLYMYYDEGLHEGSIRGCGQFYSSENGTSDINYTYLRPVVHIKSNVQIMRNNGTKSVPHNIISY